MKNEQASGAQASEAFGQNWVQGQPAGTAQGQAAPNQPAPVAINPQTGQPYPYSVQPKQPMDPETKKKIIIGCSVGGGIVLLAILAAIILPIILKVDYEASYDLSSTLGEQLSDIAYNSDCSEVRYMSSTTSEEKYNEQIEGCKTLVSEARGTLEQLGASSGVTRDSEVQGQFNTLKTDFEVAFGADAAAFDAGMKKYAAVHGFLVTMTDIDRDNFSDTVKKAAEYLKNSGNEKLANFGERFEKAATNYYEAAQEYINNYSSAAYDAYSEAQDEYYEIQDEAYDWEDDTTTVLTSDAVLQAKDDSSEIWDTLLEKAG